MPLKRVTKGKQKGWKWGDSGTEYFGSDARERALRQGRAIEANKHKKKR